MSPQDIYRVMGGSLAKRTLHNGFKFRVHDVSVFKSGDAEINDLASYIQQMCVRPKSSEVCVARIFKPLAYCHEALVDLLPNVNLPMAFIYGEYDWVSRAPADHLVDNGKVVGEVF